MLGIDHIVVFARCQSQSEFLNALRQNIWTPDQNRSRNFVVNHHLYRTQNSLFFTFGVDDSLRRQFRFCEHRFHDQAGVIDKLIETLHIRIPIGDRAGRHTARHGGTRNRGRDLRNQARIEWFRDQIIAAESRTRFAVCHRDNIGLFGLGEFGDGIDRGKLHRFIDRGRANVKRAAEYEGEAQDIVDLIWVIGPAGSDHRVIAYFANFLRQDFRCGIGERQDQRICSHAFDHILFQYATRRESQKHVGAVDHLAQFSVWRFHGVARLVRVHLFLAARVHHTRNIGDPDVRHFHAECDQHIEAGKRRCACAGCDQLHATDVFADNLQTVNDGGADDDRRAVLIVVKYRNLHPLAQFFLDVKTLRRFDIFKIDAAKGRLECSDDIDQLVRIEFADFDIEYVDTGELLE